MYVYLYICGGLSLGSTNRDIDLVKLTLALYISAYSWNTEKSWNTGNFILLQERWVFHGAAVRVYRRRKMCAGESAAETEKSKNLGGTREENSVGRNDNLVFAQASTDDRWGFVLPAANEWSFRRKSMWRKFFCARVWVNELSRCPPLLNCYLRNGAVAFWLAVHLLRCIAKPFRLECRSGLTFFSLYCLTLSVCFLLWSRT